MMWTKVLIALVLNSDPQIQIFNNMYPIYLLVVVLTVAPLLPGFPGPPAAMDGHA